MPFGLNDDIDDGENRLYKCAFAAYDKLPGELLYDKPPICGYAKCKNYKINTNLTHLFHTLTRNWPERASRSQWSRRETIDW